MTTGANITAHSSHPSAPPKSTQPPVDQGRFRRAGQGGRLAAAVVIGVAAGLLLSDHQSWAATIVGGWDCGSFTLLALNWHIIWTSDADQTKRRAAMADPGRTAAWLLALVASSFSLFAGAVALRHASTIDPERSPLLVALCLIAVGAAWNLTHTTYTLRYAHLFYRDSGREGGLKFPGNTEPDDFDFAYFAYTIGMTFQVSDVAVTSSQIRRTVLAHAVLSFAYNTVIIALVLNMLVGALN